MPNSPSLLALASPVDGAIGWIEMDGIQGDSSPNEEVHVSDMVDQYVTVYINNCYSW